ncbi:MAG: RHS repeat-associated core domain-containing protein [Marinagarivorans sp.]
MARTMVLDANGKPILVEYNEDGSEAGEVSYNEPFSDITVISSAEYAQYQTRLKDYQTRHADDLAKDARLLSAAEFKSESFLSADGKPITKPNLPQGINSVFVRGRSTSILLPSQASAAYDDLVLMTFPVDLTENINVPKNGDKPVGSIVLNKQGQKIKSSTLSIAPRVGFYGDPSKPQQFYTVARKSDDKIFGGVKNIPVYVFPDLFPGSITSTESKLGREGKYSMQFRLPYCPIGMADMDMMTDITAELHYTMFSPNFPNRSYYLRRQDWTYCVDPRPCNEHSIAAQMACLNGNAILATIALPSYNIDLKVDVMFLSGQAALYGPSGPVPVGNTTEYKVNPANNNPTTQNFYDFDGDGQPDQSVLGEMGPIPQPDGSTKTGFIPNQSPNSLQAIYFSSRPDKSQPNVTRLADKTKSPAPNGLVSSISKEDFKNTDIMVFRESTGELVVDRRGLPQSEIDEAVKTDTGLGKDNKSFFYRIMLRGPMDTAVNSGGGFIQRRGSWQDYATQYKLAEPFQKREANHLKSGEWVRIVIINRPTGYIGTQRVQLKDASTNAGSSLNVPIDDIVLRPPNLKIWAERDYTQDSGLNKGKEEKNNIIGAEGASLGSDDKIIVYSEWLDADGTPLPEGLGADKGAAFGLTGRLAKVVGSNTLQSVAAGSLAEFPIAPGLNTQVLRLKDNLTSSEHFYIHVTGTAKNEKPDFSTPSNSESLAGRPQKITPFLTPQFDENSDWFYLSAWNQAKQKFIAKEGDTVKPIKPLPAYEWVYRPEYQFSQLALEVTSIKTQFTTSNGVNTQTILPSPDEPGANAIDPNADLLDLFYGLTQQSQPRLPAIDGEQELVFSLGAEEVKASLDANGKVTFKDLEHLSRLQPQDLLTLRLYDNNDAGNVLWQYAFEIYGEKALSRAHLLALFNDTKVLTFEKSDSYTIIDIPLDVDAKTQVKIEVNILDEEKKQISKLVSSQVEPNGIQKVVVLRKDVEKLLPRAEHSGFIQVNTQPLDGSKNHEKLYKLKLEESIHGEMLGQIIEFDTLIQRGALSLRREDMVLQGAGPQLNFSRSYANESKPENNNSPLGPGWSHNHNIYIQILAEGDGKTPYENNLPNWVGKTRSESDQPLLLDAAKLRALMEGKKIPTRVAVSNGGTFKLVGNSWVGQRGNHGTLTQTESGWEYRSKDGTVYSFGYQGEDKKAFVDTVTDRNGNTLKYGPYLYLKNVLKYKPYIHLENETLIQKITDSAGRHLDFNYSTNDNGDMRLDSVASSVGPTLEFTYFKQVGDTFDPKAGALKSFKRADFTESYDYESHPEDPTVNLSTVTDASGRVTHYEYYSTLDSVPQDLKKVIPSLNPSDVVRYVQYPETDKKAEIKYTSTGATHIRDITDLNGYQKSYTLNSLGNPTNLVEPEGKSTTFKWSADMGEADNLLRYKTEVATNAAWEYQYDALGNLIKEIDPYGSTTEQTWDQQFSVLLYRKDKNGDTANYTPDKNGNITVEVQTATVDGAKGSVTTKHAYGQSGGFKGLLRSTTNGRSATTNFEYDDYGIINKIIEPEGSVTIYVNNPRGMRTSEIDANGNTKILDYDDLDRVKKITDAEGNTTDYTYDLKGNKKTEETHDYYLVDGTKHTRYTKLAYTYDGRDRVKLAERTGNLDGQYALTGAKTYTYDNNSNLLSESDWKGVSSAFTYDKINRRKSVKNRAGDTATTTYEFTSDGLTTTNTDFEGRTTQQFSDKLGRQVKVIHPEVTNSDGTSATYSRTMVYDKLNNVIELLDENNHTTKFAYDARQLKIKQTNAEGKDYVWQYDAAGNLSKTLDELERKTSFTYDLQNRLTFKQTPTNQTWRYDYFLNGTLKSETDPWKFTYSYTYNGINQRTSVTNPDGTETEEYTNDGKLVFKRDAEGRSISKLYGPEGRVQQSTDARGRTTTNTYDDNNNLTDSTLAWSDAASGPSEAVTHNEYDIQDRLHSTTSAFGTSVAQQTILDYDKQGNNTAVHKPEGRDTLMEYDELNRVKLIKTASVDDLARDTKQVWDGIGNKVSVIDRRGHTTNTEYDVLNRPKKITDADEKTITYTYDDVGNLRTETDRRGNTTEHTYDGLNRELERFVTGDGKHFRLLKNDYDIGGDKKNAITDANGNRVESTQDYRGKTLITTLPGSAAGSISYPASQVVNVYDKSGYLNQSTDAAGFTTSYTYYADGSVATSTDAENETTAFDYDLFGNKATITKPKGQTQTLAYDEQNRLIEVTDALLGVTRFDYDSNNNLRFQHLPAANDPNTTVEFTYDALNRKRSHVQPGNLITRFSYDAEGNLTETTDAKGQVFGVTYDALNRAKIQTYPAGSDLTSIENTYDGNGNLKSITETLPNGGKEITTHDFDLLNRLIYQDQRGHIITYAYDNNGNRKQVASIGGTTDYTYDTRNRLSTVTGTSLTTYQYFANGWLQMVTHGNKTAVNYTYDNTGRTKSITNTLAPTGVLQQGSPLSTFAYTYDSNGNRKQQVETQYGFLTAQTLTTDYTYDDLDRLESFKETSGATTTQHSFTYFPSYDRKTEKVESGGTTLRDRTYEYNGLFWLTSITEKTVGAADQHITYQYDNNGNTIEKTDTTAGAKAASVIYRYNSRNQLHSVAQGVKGAEVSQGTYAYNFAGMRTRHIGSERGDIEYLYDDKSVIDEVQNNSNSLVAHYRYGDRLLSLTSGGSDQFYHYAALGTTANLTNAAGAQQVAYRTDPFGEITHQEGTSVNRHVFTGKETDEKTGLIYFGARFYDPDTARFINQDSYLGKSGTPPSLHRYLYAYSNPTVYMDDNGHFVGTILGGITGTVWGIGQTIGAGINDTINHFAYGEKFRSVGEYASITAQNAIAGAEMGAAVDVGAMSGGLALPASGALGNAGFGGLSFDGRAKPWKDYGVDQAKDAAIGAIAGPVLAKAGKLLGKAGEWAAAKSETVNAVGKYVGAKASVLGEKISAAAFTQDGKALAAKIESAASVTKEKVSGLLKPSQAANVSESAAAGSATTQAQVSADSEIFYRGMCREECNNLPKPELGIKPRGGGNYVTQDKNYIDHLVEDSPLGETFDVIVKFRMKPGTKQQLIDNGALENLGPAIRREGLMSKPQLKDLTKAEKKNMVNLKSEGPDDSLTFGLRPGKSVDIFNKNIESYEVIEEILPR